MSSTSSTHRHGGERVQLENHEHDKFNDDPAREAGAGDARAYQPNTFLDDPRITRLMSPTCSFCPEFQRRELAVGKARVDIKTETLIEITDLRHRRGHGAGELVRKYLRRDETQPPAAGDQECQPVNKE